jgi:hypothetical protein
MHIANRKNALALAAGIVALAGLVVGLRAGREGTRLPTGSGPYQVTSHNEGATADDMQTEWNGRNWHHYSRTNCNPPNCTPNPVPWCYTETHPSPTDKITECNDDPLPKSWNIRLDSP